MAFKVRFMFEARRNVKAHLCLQANLLWLKLRPTELLWARWRWLTRRGPSRAPELPYAIIGLPWGRACA